MELRCTKTDGWPRARRSPLISLRRACTASRFRAVASGHLLVPAAGTARTPSPVPADAARRRRLRRSFARPAAAGRGTRGNRGAGAAVAREPRGMRSAATTGRTSNGSTTCWQWRSPASGWIRPDSPSAASPTARRMRFRWGSSTAICSPMSWRSRPATSAPGAQPDSPRIFMSHGTDDEVLPISPLQPASGDLAAEGRLSTPRIASSTAATWCRNQSRKRRCSGWCDPLSARGAPAARGTPCRFISRDRSSAPEDRVTRIAAADRPRSGVLDRSIPHSRCGSMAGRRRHGSLRPWVVLRIHVDDIERADAVDLDHRFGFGHGVMRHPGRQVEEARRRQRTRRRAVDFVARGDREAGRRSR
jgi:hypothetical protein